MVTSGGTGPAPPWVGYGYIRLYGVAPVDMGYFLVEHLVLTLAMLA